MARAGERAVGGRRFRRKKADELRARIDEARDAWLGLGKGWHAFWNATPYIAMRQMNASLKSAHEVTVTSAWMAEYMTRQKSLKPLKSYLKSGETKRALKPGEKMDATPWLALMGVVLETKS